MKGETCREDEGSRVPTRRTPIPVLVGGEIQILESVADCQVAQTCFTLALLALLTSFQ